MSRSEPCRYTRTGDVVGPKCQAPRPLDFHHFPASSVPSAPSPVWRFLLSPIVNSGSPPSCSFRLSFSVPGFLWNRSAARDEILASPVAVCTMSKPSFWSTPFRYFRWASHERPAYFWSIIIGSMGPVVVLTVPPIRRYFGDVDPEPIPLTYPGTPATAFGPICRLLP